MNELQTFTSAAFGSVRIIDKGGQPWFVGKDVADILGYSNSSKAIPQHVDEEDRQKQNLPTAQNGKLVAASWLINESGLYSLILSSKMPKAKEFKRWVTSEVIPAIRKTGGYIAGSENMTDADLVEAAEENLARLFSIWTGVPLEYSVNYPNDFKISEVEQELANAEIAKGLNFGDEFNMEVFKRVLTSYLPELKADDFDALVKTYEEHLEQEKLDYSHAFGNNGGGDDGDDGQTGAAD